MRRNDMQHNVFKKLIYDQTMAKGTNARGFMESDNFLAIGIVALEILFFGRL